MIATVAWCIPGPGAALAQEPPIPFRPACELLTPDAVSAVLGVTVSPDATMPDAVCSYLDGTQEVASIRLGASPPLVLTRFTGLRAATDTTVGGVPALSTVSGGTGSSAVVAFGSQDRGTVEVQVERAPGADSPLAAARSLAEAIVATGPVTAHATPPTAEPLVLSGSPCRLTTRVELTRLIGRPFADGELDVNQSGCWYRSKDRTAAVSIGIGVGDLGSIRFTDSMALVVGGRAAIDVPMLEFLTVDLGGGQRLGVRIAATDEGIRAEDVPALRVAIAEAALARMAPGAITCPLIATDALLGAGGLDLQPLATVGPDWCWFVTPDDRTGLFLRVVAKRDVAYVRGNLRSAFPDLPPPTDLEVSGRQAAGTTGASGTMLSVRLDKVPGQGRGVLFALLVGADPTATDPLALLASVADVVLDGR